MKRTSPVPTPRDADLPSEIRVLHVDDEADFVDMASEFLERADERISVRPVTDPERVIDVIEEFDAHCIVSDYDMPGTNGLELFDELRDAGFDLPFILFTGKGSETIAADAMTAGVTDYIQKGGTDTYEVVANRIRSAVKSRQRKQAIDRAVTHYTALVETSHNPVYLYDEDGNIQYANEASAEIFGADDPETLVGESFFDLLPEETHEEIRSRLSALSEEKQIPETEFEFEDLNGQPRRARISCAPTPHHDEAVGQTIAHDVQRIERAETELRRFRRFVRTALEEADAGLWVHDVRSDRISRYGVPSVLDVPPEELDDSLGSFLAHVHPDDRESLESAYADAVETAGSFCVDFRVETDSGATRHLEDRGAAITDGDGEVTHLIGIVVDVTDRQRRRQQLLRERDQLEEMATILSHDLGNALDTAEGYLTLAADGDAEHIDDAAAAVRRAGEMVESLAEIARDGKPVTDLSEVSLREAAETACRTTALPADQLDVRSDAVLRADSNALQRLLENLLSNAVEHGGPDVRVAVGASDGGFYVADDGTGLPDPADGIFEFRTSTSSDGRGVGLASVRQIARSHGWTVEAVDAEDGARFEVSGVDIKAAPRAV